MHHIRPYRIFTLLAEPPSERIAQVKIPMRRDLKLLETFLLIAAIRLVNARRVFEFGTFLGSTTLNLALNTPPGAEILTLDLDGAFAGSANQDPLDAELTRTHLASKATLEFLETPISGKIRILTGNSTTFDFSPWKRTCDLVFIDGGHDFSTVKADTENALELVSLDRPSCVFWHDYRNADYSGLSYYLDDLSRRLDIFHIEDTMLCAWFHDPEGNILPRLLQPSYD